MLCRGMCATVCCFINKFLGLSKLHLIFLKIQPGCVAVEAVCQHWSYLLMYWKFQTMLIQHSVKILLADQHSVKSTAS